ncbi:MAG: hypothetical protein HC905_16770, partial [Bacteroidales bacterium]|nr:hypothetical protein [Bacteroidales bacterium]
GQIHLFGELHGIENIKPKRQIEFMPYTVGRTERFKKEEGNPFMNGKNNKVSGGLDGKVAITNDMTLDFTFNPDFGQVEADPSEVNLTAFETYFPKEDLSLSKGKIFISSDPITPSLLEIWGLIICFTHAVLADILTIRLPHREMSTSEYLNLPP